MRFCSNSCCVKFVVIIIIILSILILIISILILIIFLFLLLLLLFKFFYFVQYLRIWVCRLNYQWSIVLLTGNDAWGKKSLLILSLPQDMKQNSVFVMKRVILTHGRSK